MTLDEVIRIAEKIHDEMTKANADIKDFFDITELVAGMAFVKLMEMGAPDSDIEKAIELWSESFNDRLPKLMKDFRSNIKTLNNEAN